MRCQNRHILNPLAKRRHIEGNHVQPVKQILAKRIPADFVLKLFVRRGDHSHVNGNRLIRAQPFHALFFQHAQHFRLSFQAHIAHFIEK